MRLGYFSPLTPQRSGIADYSEELLPYLAEAADITLFVDGFQPMNRALTSRFEVLDYRRKRSHLKRLSEFDVVIYHFGNDHRYHTGMLEAMKVRPGVVVFHDFALQDFFLGLARETNDLRLYLDEVEFCYGASARNTAAESFHRGATPAIVNQPLHFPLNCRIAKSAEGIIIHSTWQAERFAELAPSVPVAQIKHHITAEAAVTLPSSKRETTDAIVRIASFGLITPDKGIERALRVLARLRNSHNFRYTLVGSATNFPELPGVIQRYGLQDRVTITGHVSLDEFQRQIRETDVAICLRERSVGATSGSLCRIMAAGVAAIVSDVGAFSEFPNDAVVKIDHNEHADALLDAYLRKLIDDSSLRNQIGANARAYVLAEHRIETSAQRYLAFMHEIVSARPRRSFVSSVASEVSALGVRGSDDTFMESLAAEVSTLAPVEVFHIDDASSSSVTKPAHENGNGRRAPVNGRGASVEGIDYKRGAVEYLSKVPEERRHHLRTKPFYNLANKPARYRNAGMDEDTHRHFCDFANIAVTLALEPGSTILDVGCGSGWLSEYFARLGYHVKGIDISPDLIEMSRERVARVPYGADHETPLRCTFEVHDIETAPLHEKFDAIICYDSLHHFSDEQSVVRHLAEMAKVGSTLFVLEGDRPAAGSISEEELRDVMSEFGTLESPFDYGYLRQLLEENGFAVTGDYVSVNGLFSRDEMKDDHVPVTSLDANYHYLACKKVIDGAHASTISDSRTPGILKAKISAENQITKLSAGQKFELAVTIKNEGDTLWLTSPQPRSGIVMPATRIIDDAQNVVSEIHGEPVFPNAVAPGEIVKLRLQRVAPHLSGRYTLKLDLVDQHVCWFEQAGSQPLIIPFEVS